MFHRSIAAIRAVTSRRKLPRESLCRKMLVESLEPRIVLDANFHISEFMAVNDSVLADADGDSSDWIELFNAGDSAGSLEGWFLTDDAGDLTKWTFPSISISAGNFLVVFASGKDRVLPDNELHTNFRLDGGGEYLALVAPDGVTVQSEFAPTYPAQRTDISYGIAETLESVELVKTGAPAKILIPDAENDAQIGSQWTSTDPAFDDSNWLQGPTPIGWQVATPGPPPGDPLRIDFSQGNGDPLQNGWESFSFGADGGGLAARSFDHPRLNSAGNLIDVSITGNTHWRDYQAATGMFAAQSDLLRDGPLCNAACEMVLRFDGLRDGTYEITTIHHTTQFGPSQRVGNPFDILLSDSQVNNQLVAENVFMSDNASDVLSQQIFSFVVSGGSPVSISFVKIGGNDHFALSGLELNLTTEPSFAVDVATDIQQEMFTVNASAYIRIPFIIEDDPASFDRLLLRMKYDDGFAAFINGVPVAHRNAPETLLWKSTATNKHPTEQAIVFETIDISAHRDSLRVGTNTLSIHGLNLAVDDLDFLAWPELEAVRIIESQQQYFDEPTPGSMNTSGFAGFIEDTKFSVDRGIFDSATDAFDVEITTGTDDVTILYTTDGSRPGVDESGAIVGGIEYAGPIHIDRTTTLRAMAFKPEFRDTNVDTQTYLFLDDVLDQNSSPPDGYPSTWGGTLTDWGLDQNETDLKRIAGDPNFTIDEARDVIKDSLRSLPTMSIVMDIDDVFGSRSGIYANTQGRGDAWEKPASVELIHPDGTRDDLQIDAGIRIQGFTSRDPSRNPKHSLRLIFRKEYGAGKLNYPLFGEDAAQSFDTIVLRSNSQDAWVYDSASNRQGQFVRDEWARRTQLAMGQPAAHGTWVHLYINGLYWGVYNPTERPDSSFNESYFGGDKDDYDSLKNHEEVLDGTGDAYRQLLTLIQNNPSNFSAGYRDFTSDAAYQRVQGNNPDGTPNPTFQDYLDVPNLIDYMIHNMYAAATDWPGNNYIGRDRTDSSEGFKFFDWDNEHGMKPSVTVNRTLPHSRDADSPTKFHHALRTNAEYQMLFADRLHRALFNGGPLYVDPENPEWDAENPQRNVPAALWMELTGEIEESLIAEAARWGDVRGIQYTPDNQFQTLRNSLLRNWFPNRSRILLDQFKQQGLYPDTNAPAFHINGQYQHGGQVLAGDVFSLVVPSADGAIVNEEIVLPEFSVATAIVATENVDALIGADWFKPDFAEGAAGESGWKIDPGGVGYDTSSTYDQLINLDVESDMAGKQTSVFTRFRFEFDGSEFDQLFLKMKYDDGFVAYLNGVEIASANAPGGNGNPGTLAWDSTATDSHNDSDAIVFEEFDITPFSDLLVAGETNVLAIHGLNVAADSSDMLISPEIVGRSESDLDSQPVYFTTDGTDPRLTGGAINPNAQQYTGSFALDESVQIQARTLIRGQWSALNEVLFTAKSPLVISEIMYNSEAQTADELERSAGVVYGNDQFEFIELLNTSSVMTIELFDYRFENGIQFSFSVESLTPGERIVVARNRDALVVRYGTEIRLAEGQYGSNTDPLSDSKLSNGGERLQLVDVAGGSVFDVTYADDWHTSTDGAGFSLVLIDSAPGDADLSQADRWRPSFDIGGSPGEEDILTGDVDRDLRVNLIDLIILQANFGRAGNVGLSDGDVDGSGQIDAADFRAMVRNFGNGFDQPVMPLAANSPLISSGTQQDDGITIVASVHNDLSGVVIVNDDSLEDDPLKSDNRESFRDPRVRREKAARDQVFSETQARQFSTRNLRARRAAKSESLVLTIVNPDINNQDNNDF